jgi:pilus assembly protein CpaC
MNRRMIKHFGIGAAVVALSVGGSASAQFQGLAGGPPAGSASSAPTIIPITRGKSAYIDFDYDIRIGGATDPGVAQVRMVTPRRAMIMGVGYGQTDAQFLDAAGRVAMNVNVRVEQDITALDEAIARIVPGASISTQSVADNIILTGTVENAADADRAVQMAAIFAGSAEQVRNFLTITGNDQVMLHVQVVEVNRTIVKQLGFNIDAIIGGVGEDQLLLGNTPSYGVNGGYQGGFLGGFQSDIDSSADVEAVLQAFERQGLIRTLAEPNLTAVSGESAQFLAGGEYPVPASQDANGNVTVEFKPFGVGLSFTPVVLSDGRISVAIETEVSDLSNQGALSLNGFAGAGTNLVIPALTVRRASSVVEVPSGGSIMMAGLLQESTQQNIDKVPGIADVPVLGALARSRDFINNETELVIIATVNLVSPTSRGKLQTPSDGLRIASDMETILLGKLNSANSTPPEATEGRSYEGPFGYVID